MGKILFICITFVFALFLLFSPVAHAAIITCGATSDDMCTLCDMVAGFNTIIQYLMKISIGVALLAISIGGILYVVSAGEPGAVETAKKAIKNGIIGFVIVFSAFIIIGTVISYLGVQEGMGIRSGVTWGTFDCTAAGVR
ncbi:MAG TPA: pilin [Candidatus Moranbacteria bacterium]|nr:pilin [Candidatus Moranbacteria bacterium]